MKKFCPNTYTNSVRLLSVVLITTGFLFGINSHSYAQELGTNVEFRTEFPGTAAGIGAQSNGQGPVTGVIQAGWVINDPARAQQIVDELNANFGRAVIRVSSKKVGDSFAAMTTGEARQIGQVLNNVTGIHAVEFGNEVNNIESEWVGGTIDSYIDAYNAFAGVTPSLRIGPAALDTFFANDAYTVARRIRAGISRVDVLFFNAYENRPEDVWSTDTGCSLPDAQQRETGCSWRGLAQAYGGAGELILTEFSLKPKDKDTDLTQVLRYISTIGPKMSPVSIITPLVRDACGAGKTGWLYLVRRSEEPSVNGFGLVTEAGEIVDPASCAKTPGSERGSLFDLIYNLLVRLTRAFVSKDCDPLSDVLNGLVDDSTALPVVDLLTAEQTILICLFLDQALLLLSRQLLFSFH